MKHGRIPHYLVMDERFVVHAGFEPFVRLAISHDRLQRFEGPPKTLENPDNRLFQGTI